MFVRMCPYFPFSARIYLNQHHWIAARLRAEGIAFQQCANAFLRCADPARLQAIANSLTPIHLLRCGQKWLTAFTPFFTATERREAGCQHRLFFSQVEYCDNLISGTAPRSISLENGCSTPTVPSASPTKSP